MATSNIWQQFKALIPEGDRAVVMIIAQNNAGTSTATLRDGTAVVVKGNSVSVGKKAFVQNGEVKGAAPDLVQYEAEV